MNEIANLAVDDPDRNAVRHLAAYGLPSAMIAHFMRLSDEVLHRKFEEDLKDGEAIAAVVTAKNFHLLAVGVPAIYDPDTGKIIQRERKPSKRVLRWMAENFFGFDKPPTARQRRWAELRMHAQPGPLAITFKHDLISGLKPIDDSQSARAARERSTRDL